MMKVYLIRHGSTAYTREGRLQGTIDIPLSAEGKVEAGLLADRLAELPLHGIYCSPLQRARETAAAIARPHHLKLHILPYLREFCWGPLEGMRWAEVTKRYPHLVSPSNRGLPLSVPGGESLRQIKARTRLLAHFLRQRVLKVRDGQLALITHGRFLQLFLLHALGLPLTGPRPFVLYPASVSIVEIKSPVEPFRLTLLNDTCHLRPTSACGRRIRQRAGG